MPKGCCRTVYYSSEYVPSYKCNFLGVSTDVSVPIDTALCVLIDVTEKPVSSEAAAASGHHSVTEYHLADDVMSTSGPPSMLLYAPDTDDLFDFSKFHYSVEHSSKALPSIGLCNSCDKYVCHRCLFCICAACLICASRVKTLLYFVCSFHV